MATPGRRLIPEEHDNTTTRISCTSNVVGVVPEKVHQFLSSNHDTTSSCCEQQQQQRGRVDDHSSGISFLLGQGMESHTISLWEHSTQTLNEDLIAPANGLCVKLSHPEHEVDPEAEGSNGSASDDLLVACLGPNNNNATTGLLGGGERLAYGREMGRTLRHVYAASPTTGVLCVWVLDTLHPHKEFVDCDASVRLKLKPNEVLSALTPMNASSGEGGSSSTAWLLASTSLGRLWKIYKTTRPLTLHAKLVKRKMVPKTSAFSDGGDAGEEEGTGIVKGLYHYMFTPSKTSTVHHGAEDTMEGGETDGVSEEDEHIVALVPLLPSVMEGETVDSTPRGPRRTPPPRKQQKLSTPQHDTSCARVLSLGSTMVLKEWKVSLVSGIENDDGRVNSAVIKEGYISRLALFPRYEDGTLNLDNLEANMRGYHTVDILATPTLAIDGQSVLLTVRIEREGDAEATRVYILRIGLGGDSPQVLDAAWLDRYSGQSISSSGGSLECAGLVVSEVEEDNVMPNVGCVGACVAYVGFGPRGGTDGEGQPCPVTISAVNFSSDTAGGQHTAAASPRVKDLDLFSTIVPSAVKDSMSYDSLTGGCVFLSTSGLLGGASVRFPPTTTASRGSGDEAMAGPVDDEAVVTIKSHLQSAFRQYLNKVKEGGGVSSSARSVVPPSIGSCSSQVLSAAVVLASKDYVCASSSGSSMMSPTGKNPLMTLRDKLQHHRDFVNFVLHAGAYRKVSSASRIKLRDHGEMLTAARDLLVECQGYFSLAETAAGGDDARRGEIAQARQMVTAALEGTSDNVMFLPERWARLQQLCDTNSPLYRDLLLLASRTLCYGLGQAIEYRLEESGPLYDISNRDSSSSSSNNPPWTSSPEMLKVLYSQLQAIQQGGESILSKSLDYDTDKANMRQYVEDLSSSALAGHRDVFMREPNSEYAMKSYEDTKILAIPLLRQYANDDGDDLVALDASLEHSFFEGIVQICYDHRKSWRFQGPFSDKEPDDRYDLRPMMSNSSSDSPHAHLHESRDGRTGLPFCGYVLKWYADRGLYHEVFELGKNCPHDLTRYVRNDDRLFDLAWVQQLRDGGHEQATVGLLSLNKPLLFGDKREGTMGLWEKNQMMSLAKLSNKLATAKTTNPAVDNQRGEMIDDNLTLISAQTILQEDTELGDEIALKADDLVRLALEKMESARDIDEMYKCAICGLSIAAAKSLNNNEAMVNDASSIWHAVIQADMDTWQSVSNEDRMAVGGLSEEDLIQHVEGTAFVRVMSDFVATSPSSDTKTQTVSFASGRVQSQVMHAFGSNELAKVLSLTTNIVVAANS